MRKITLSIALVFFLMASMMAQYSKVEDITIESTELNQTREIMVHTPLGYNENDYAYYNVIYVFDAQNRRFFDYVSSLAMLSKEAGQGFIVVGIKATTITEKENGETKYTYFRNMDLLPRDTEFFGGRYKGNSEAFLAYVKNEVVPYVEANYRVLPGKMAVGHSLSASFLIYSLLNEPDLFDSYIAVSPNVDYDNERLVKGLRDFETENLSSTKYLYVSHGDEGESFGWQEANEHAYALLKDTLHSDKLKVTVENYPEENHGSNFIYSVSSAMRTYLETIRPKWNKEFSEEKYEVTFRLKVLNEEDEIYLAGNQSSLGDWNSDQIKMKKISPLIREITLNVRDHVEVVFFRDGKSQAWIKYGEGGRSTYPMMIRPKEGAEYVFEVDSYMN